MHDDGVVAACGTASKSDINELDEAALRRRDCMLFFIISMDSSDQALSRRLSVGYNICKLERNDNPLCWCRLFVPVNNGKPLK